MDFRDPSYLEQGTARQQAAYAALRELNLFALLAEYQPLLVGTIPLRIDRPGSDLDILCQAQDLAAFAARVTALFGGQPAFTVKMKPVREVPSLIARFDGPGFPVEIFAQALAVEQQNGYRHLRIEQRLLQVGGAPVREAIRRMKQAGYATEPAFASYFGLPGDPYQALLDLEALEDAELEALTKRRLLCGLCEN